MNQINKIKLIALGLLILAGLNSCSEDVLDQAPPSELSQANFWKNNNQALLGVGAIYDAMQSHYRTRYFYYGEFRSDNHIGLVAGDAQNVELVTNTIQPTSGQTVAWTDLYQMIGRANNAIENIPNIPGYDASLLAEAYALRAYAYFDIVRVWDGAPVFLETIKSLNEDLSRPATDGETIMRDIVIPDMLKAEELIVPPSAKYRFSKNAVWAFEASVYMWMNDYVKAKEKLDLIVDDGAYSLTTTRKQWSDLFANDSGRTNSTDPEDAKIQEGPELIFSLNYDFETGGDDGGIYSLFFAGVPSYNISPLAENKWIAEFPIDSLSWVAKYPDPADLPKTFQEDEEGNTLDSRLFGDWRYFETREAGKPIGEARVAKWNTSNYRNTVDNTDVVFYRYAGVLSMLAEAENQLDNQARSLELFNQIRTSRQLPTLTETDWVGLGKDGRENKLLDERQFELFGEAKRWWDLRRTNKAVEILAPINGQTEATLVFPYFVDHLVSNPELVQKAGY